MTSRGIILLICFVVILLHWSTDMFPGGVVPLAFIASFLAMEWTGMFKRELAAYNTARGVRREQINNEELTDRQKDFLAKMKKSVEEDDDPEKMATIKIMDADGKVSSIFINDDGDVSVEGNPDPELVEAAKSLSESAIKHGPDAIAQELNKQIEKINKGKDNVK